MLMIMSCMCIFKIMYYILGGWIYNSGRKTSKNPNWFREARAAACHYRIRGSVFLYQISLFHRIHILGLYHSFLFSLYLYKIYFIEIVFQTYGENSSSAG